MRDLLKFQNSHPKDSVFFVRIPDNATNSKPTQTRSRTKTSSFSSRHTKASEKTTSARQHKKLFKSSDSAFKIFCQLHNLNFLNIKPASECSKSRRSEASMTILTSEHSFLEESIDYCYSASELDACEKAASEFCVKWEDLIICLLDYLVNHLKVLAIRGTTILFKFHESCLGKLINFTYEMVRHTVISPAKIKYAREKEQLLFDNLNNLANVKQEELREIISITIENNRQKILDCVEAHVIRDIDLISFSDRITDDLYIVNIDEDLSESCSTHSSLSSSGELTSARIIKKQTVKHAKDQRKCTSQIHELVMNKINECIAVKLEDSIQILKENYIGTLKRCLQSLEDQQCSAQDSERDNLNSASKSLQIIINSVYHFDINLAEQSNILDLFVHKIKEIFTALPWSSCPVLDKEWKLQTGNNLINSISATKLSKIFCNQMKERLKSSHLLFLSSIKALENKLNSRLEKNEDCQRLIRKSIAPRFAKLSLESASLKDYLLHGFPHLSKEIGRGQYGVVYRLVFSLA